MAQDIPGTEDIHNYSLPSCTCYLAYFVYYNSGGKYGSFQLPGA